MNMLAPFIFMLFVIILQGAGNSSFVSCLNCKVVGAWRWLLTSIWCWG